MVRLQKEGEVQSREEEAAAAEPALPLPARTCPAVHDGAAAGGQRNASICSVENLFSRLSLAFPCMVPVSERGRAGIIMEQRPELQ